MPRLGEEVSGPPQAPAAFPSIPAMLAARAAVDPARAAVRSRNAGGKWQDLTWAALDARRRAIAGGLAALGVKPGDVVAVVAPNSVEMLLAEMGILTAGGASAPVFGDYAPDILLHCLTDSGARVAFAGSAVQQHKLAGARGIERIIVLDDQPLEDARALPLKAIEQLGTGALAEPQRDDVAFLLYTSGTTGKPRGVELTHGNVLSQQENIAAVWDPLESTCRHASLSIL